MESFQTADVRNERTMNQNSDFFFFVICPLWAYGFAFIGFLLCIIYFHFHLPFLLIAFFSPNFLPVSFLQRKSNRAKEKKARRLEERAAMDAVCAKVDAANKVI